MAVTVSGMFGGGRTYFADSPVIIDISGLEWPGGSPFSIVRVEVYHDGRLAGEVRGDTGGQTSMSLDISSALRAIWAEYGFTGEVQAAQGALTSATAVTSPLREYRSYSLIVYTEYIAGDGVFTRTSSGMISGGQCLIGGLTEWERSLITDDRDRDVSHLEHTGVRNGDASTKPTSTPERVGKDSITSWADVSSEGTQSVFYPAGTEPAEDGTAAHAPIVLRDGQDYVDFLFRNRRGAIETCSGQTLEAMSIDVETKQYSRVERPAFRPSRSLMAVGSDGRRSWQMSSGLVTREWAEWWATEFLGGRHKQWWMRYKGPGMTAEAYVPVIVEPSKKSIAIYDKAKQQMPHADFTVTLALEG